MKLKELIAELQALKALDPKNEDREIVLYASGPTRNTDQRHCAREHHVREVKPYGAGTVAIRGECVTAGLDPVVKSPPPPDR